jgi:response regulator of citrate/malate metabolism
MQTNPNLCTLDLLYVEDSPSDQRLLQEVLGNSRDVAFTIRFASTLEEAEALFLASEPDIVLSDLNLADHRGKDTVDKVATLFRGKPVILFTESKNMEITRYASSLGIQDFLIKEEDFEASKLVRAIQMAKIRYDKEYQKLLEINEELSSSLAELKESQLLIRNQVNHFSHKVRGPICTIEGLLNLLETTPPEITHDQIYVLLRSAFCDLKHQVDTTVGKLEGRLHLKKREPDKVPQFVRTNHTNA